MNKEKGLPGEASVVVIGGGPAGATVSTRLAQKGHDVLLLEREVFPRFHVGESLMTETYWVFEKLGILEKLRGSACPVKASVQFVSASGRESKPFYFFERNPHASSYTWQIERSWFDQLMLENAADKGVDVRHGVNVRELVLNAGERVTGVEASIDGGPTTPIRSQVVVNASGLNSLIARRFGLRKKDPKLVKASVFAHYGNGLRDPGVDEGATIILNTSDSKGWFWYIPLSKNRVSVGVVSSPEELFRDGKDLERILEREIANCPGVSRRLREARRLTPPQVLSDFSYRASRCAGDGWALVGDAFGFLDPIYSSGVMLALRSGDMAAESIGDALEHNDCSAERLGAFGPELLRGMEAVRKLVYAFYAPGFSIGKFLSEHPEHHDRVVDILIGDVFKGGLNEVFDAMKPYCELPPEATLESR